VLGFRRAGTRPVADRFDEPTPERLRHATDVLSGAGIRRAVLARVAG
jgi:hypothetical protein